MVRGSSSTTALYSPVSLHISSPSEFHIVDFAAGFSGHRPHTGHSYMGNGIGSLDLLAVFAQSGQVLSQG